MSLINDSIVFNPFKELIFKRLDIILGNSTDRTGILLVLLSSESAYQF